MNIEDTLKERGDRYGSFLDYANTVHDITVAMDYRSNPSLQPVHCEALNMIVGKIARILNGDPNYADSWHDIAGYATLVEKELSK